jgi:ATP synthase protein I
LSNWSTEVTATSTEKDGRARRRRLAERIQVKEKRKKEARRNKDQKSVWFGLGMFGLVGWSVAMPTLIFVAIGIWIDSRWPSRVSWTLTLLLIGIALGCLNAWFWIKRESRNV